MMVFAVVVCLLYLSLLCDSTAPCSPSPGRTAVVIGQDFVNIKNFTTSLQTLPFGVMSYASLIADAHQLIPGLESPTDYGSGIEWAHGSLQAGLTDVLQLGLYIVDLCEDIVHGLYDREIAQLASFLRRDVNMTVYLRIGYEFESVLNRYEPELYKQAFAYIVKMFRSQHHDLSSTLSDNVVFVWHSVSKYQPEAAAAGTGGVAGSIDFMKWYPGDEFVSWCGISLFDNVYECVDASNCHLEYVDRLATFCKQHALPLMIAESTPFGGIVDEESSNAEERLFLPPQSASALRRSNEANVTGSTWDRWFEPVLSLIEKYDIRMWCYINCNWDEQPMWRKEHAPGVHWGDSRIQEYPGVRQKWEQRVLNSTRFRWSIRAPGKPAVDTTLNCIPTGQHGGPPIMDPTSPSHNGPESNSLSWLGWSVTIFGWLVFIAILALLAGRVVGSQDESPTVSPPVIQTFSPILVKAARGGKPVSERRQLRFQSDLPNYGSSNAFDGVPGDGKDTDSYAVYQPYRPLTLMEEGPFHLELPPRKQLSQKRAYQRSSQGFHTVA